MNQTVLTDRKTINKEANAMASNDVEVLDPETPVENLPNISTGSELNRRNFLTALGVAGAAAGAALLTTKSAQAQQPSPNGFAQVDVINLLLNIKYLKATLYSYITQGTDLPASSFVTVGTGAVYNAPAKITFSSQQITDLFNEMYYDELNQLITLRALSIFGGSGTTPGLGVAPRPTINLLGTGPSGSAPSSATTTLTQAQAIALSRLLEDLSATAFTNATVYLSGSNLQFVMQALATDAFHAGAVRLLAIQQGVQYQGTQYASVSTSNTAQSAVTVNASLTTGSPTIYAILGTNVPAVGQVLTGIGIPPGAGAVITAVTSAASKTPTGITTKSSNVITNVSSMTGLAVGQPVTGTNIPANAYISALGTNSISLSVAGSTTAANATASTTVSPTGYTTNGSATITGVSSISGVIVGQTITGTGIPSGATVTAASGSTITISAPATATSQTSFNGTVTQGSNVITGVATPSNTPVGTVLTGAGIPTGSTVTNLTSNSVTINNAATASSSGAEAITYPSTITLTTPTTETITVGQSVITLAGNATATGIYTAYVAVADNQDVEPGDPGSATTSAAGPSALAGTSPTMYQGFFNTAGSGTASSTSTPAGFAFARTFQQVLAILYGYNATNNVISTQNYEGGFFPYGVGGNITSAT